MEKARSAGVVAWPSRLDGAPPPAGSKEARGKEAARATLSAAGDAAESDDEADLAEQKACADATERGAALLEDFLLRFGDSDSDDSDLSDHPQIGGAKPHPNRRNMDKYMTLAECISAVEEREKRGVARPPRKSAGDGGEWRI